MNPRYKIVTNGKKYRIRNGDGEFMHLLSVGLLLGWPDMEMYETRFLFLAKRKLKSLEPEQEWREV